MKSIKELPWYIRLTLIFQYPGLDAEYCEYQGRQRITDFVHYKTYKGEKYEVDRKPVQYDRGF